MSALTPADLARYRRHLSLPGFGEEGQRRLKASRMLVIGAGGLGCPAALYLAAAGVGTVGLADHDRVDASNLQRQILHGESDVGRPKLDSAADRLRALGGATLLRLHPEGVTPENAVSLFSDYDVILDATDNFATRYLVNDAAVLARRPLVHASLYQFEGQVTVVAPHLGGPCYRCLFPAPPPPGSVPDCGVAGVLGAVCGVVGSLAALEAIKLAAGLGTPLIGRVLTYDALTPSTRALVLPRDRSCPACGDHRTLGSLEPERYGGRSCFPSPMSSDTPPLEITVSQARDLLAAGKALLLDVREPSETSVCRVAGARLIPMGDVPARLGEIPRDRPVLVMCHHGGRSLRVTRFLRDQGLASAINVAGGIDAWALEVEPGMARY